MAAKHSDESIPVNMKRAAVEIAAVCRKYGIRQCKAKLLPSHDEPFPSHQEIELFWTQGRHGADRGQALLSFDKRIRVEIDAELADG